uniref:Nucleolar protein 14 n=1 Tax=Pseudo-nitzschia australis TaxID=44445 RepID=A0A6U9X837_9STRA|mmetsp:Transcript_21317/g.46568  ORF Transcript_21317/g.46568 Transcript_21317/m.46568 type:complete len:976 (+) Transcript_21317:93-3020(+)|eukprot:CAMPEP_0168167222 /NCGR_PEP_ID=MMETSP0139_2-20121125/2437_1 /TAXON_ID=44445 /ORGANISM="Pseudo-nitzschia australis, Strain 10249 10 AB" /LENGTH=975 /DNA_ID=CAMNT_0008084455 /DNA_START=87 /DNA_END=3014 /DNA_ORIENTATION=-
MGKRNNKAKRTLSSLPKGLVRRNGGKDPGNPFEMTARFKRPKHEVHNRPVSKPKSTKHALESLQRRQNNLRTNLKDSKKANTFVDRRIGQYDKDMSQEDKMLVRLVKERTRRSNRSSKFRLDDNDDDNDAILTHKGQKIDPNKSEAMYSDDEDDGGNLEAVDTELHFGGSGMASSNPYGNSMATGTDLSQLYGQTRKTELDDLIARRKAMKAEKMQVKETQVDTFEKMDETFGELAGLLKYRKNEKKPFIPAKLTKEDIEMKEWNTEIREMMAKPKRRATDRTKTPEEIAKDEAERLHDLETRRMARMNGDFEEDDFSDISIGEEYKKKKQKRKHRNPDELSDSDDSDDDQKGDEVKFTEDGTLIEPDEDESDSDSHDSDDDEGDNDCHPLSEGDRIRGNYRAAEQFDGRENWYEGKITKVRESNSGAITYDIEYDDGDTEENVIPKNVRPVEEEIQKAGEKEIKDDVKIEQMKRKKAKEKARKEIPFVFEAVTTLEGLHDLIGRYASTGKDASTIIKRIHASNSVRLDHRNGEKMQNFYDVLLRRFIAVGDAIFDSGDGGQELGRYNQLDSITKVMYEMAQDTPESAGAVWNRRIGILRNAHDKRLRDSDFVRGDEEMEDGGFWSAWPTTGVFLLMRALGHIFPVTDRRHHVVTPAILLLAQYTAQTPVLSTYDLTMGILCSGLLMEYSREAKRVVPEAISFMASVIRLFSPDDTGNIINPALQTAYTQPFCQSLRANVSKYEDASLPSLKIENDFIMNDESPETAVALLSLSMTLVEKYTEALSGCFSVAAETELLYEISSAVLSLRPKSYPLDLQKKISKTAALIAKVCPVERAPVQRRGRATISEMAIKTLAPRMEDPTRYSMSRDKGKKSAQAAIDRTRREYKREHKAIARELRMDGAFIESERRREKEKKDGKARAKRQKNFNWLEGEVAAMNEQVRQGGGLLTGGGTGLARAKAATGKMGIKKGGKFR